jgi:glycosyltransferase involved in cell wall biosynthesis
MRILVCNWKDTGHPLAGGAEAMTAGFTRRWAELGHEVVWASAAVPDAPRSLVLDGVHVERGGDHRFGVHRHARSIYRGEHGRFDLVVDEINTRPFAAPRWATDSRVVAFAHQVAREVWMAEMPLPVALAGRYVLEPRWLRGYRDVLTCTVSQSSLASLQQYGLRRLHLLPMSSAIDVPAPGRRYPAKSSVPTFVHVGRLGASKRPFHVLEAFAHVREALPDARLWIVGDGPLRARIERARTRAWTSSAPSTPPSGIAGWRRRMPWSWRRCARAGASSCRRRPRSAPSPWATGCPGSSTP